MHGEESLSKTRYCYCAVRMHKFSGRGHIIIIIFIWFSVCVRGPMYMAIATIGASCYRATKLLYKKLKVVYLITFHFR